MTKIVLQGGHNPGNDYKSQFHFFWMATDILAEQVSGDEGVKVYGIHFSEAQDHSQDEKYLEMVNYIRNGLACIDENNEFIEERESRIGTPQSGMVVNSDGQVLINGCVYSH